MEEDTGARGEGGPQEDRGTGRGETGKCKMGKARAGGRGTHGAPLVLRPHPCPPHRWTGLLFWLLCSDTGCHLDPRVPTSSWPPTF